ncbi:hypothetical protein HDU67_009004 [Dinochytrium kinnereticum]|nr:hypothetical protein HDU67_009004 [Dinochytrium kinnereticum]
MQKFLSQQSQTNPRLRHLRSHQPDVLVSIPDHSTAHNQRHMEKPPYAQGHSNDPPSNGSSPRHNNYGNGGRASERILFTLSSLKHAAISWYFMFRGVMKQLKALSDAF